MNHPALFRDLMALEFWPSLLNATMPKADGKGSEGIVHLVANAFFALLQSQCDFGFVQILAFQIAGE